MPDPPTGTVTFLLTDIEGSTRLWEEHPEAMRPSLARHDALITTAALLTQSLSLWRELNQQGGIGACLIGFGGVAAARGKMEHASCLLGAGRRLLNTIAVME